jgi:Flp pilus assembly protein TadD
MTSKRSIYPPNVNGWSYGRAESIAVESSQMLRQRNVIVRWRRWIASLLACAAIPPLVALPMCANGQTREEAVTMARQGQRNEAIAALRRLLDQSPDDPLVAFDLAVILTWENRSREATEAFERARGAEPLEYVLGPVIRAYRDQKRFKEAERWAREGVRLYPFDATWSKMLGLVLADQGRTSEAIEVLKPWAAVQPEDPEVWLALGYASQRSGDRYATLRNYGQALRLQPKNSEARQAMADALSELGGPFGAASLLTEAPLALRAHQAGSLVRWGESVTPRDPRRRFEETDAKHDQPERQIVD